MKAPPKPPSRQHYLPCCYQRFFSRTPERSRKARVWLSDGITNANVTVETQCWGEFFFSRKIPKQAEALLNALGETDYLDIMVEVMNGKALDSDERVYLLHFAFLTYARSTRFQVRSNEERISAISGIAGGLASMVERIRKGDHLKDAGWDYFRRLKEHYQVEVINSPYFNFYTDNPILIFDTREEFLDIVTSLREEMKPLPGIIAFPISLDHWCVIALRSQFYISSELPRDDWKKMTECLFANRLKYIYHGDNMHLKMPIPIPPGLGARPLLVGERTVAQHLFPYEKEFGFIHRRLGRATRKNSYTRLPLRFQSRPKGVNDFGWPLSRPLRLNI